MSTSDEAMAERIWAERDRALGLVARSRCWAMCATVKGEDITIEKCAGPGGHSGEHDFTPLDLREYMARHVPSVLEYLAYLDKRLEQVRAVIRADVMRSESRP